jgi:hypothetical protein
VIRTPYFHQTDPAKQAGQYVNKAVGLPTLLKPAVVPKPTDAEERQAVRDAIDFALCEGTRAAAHPPGHYPMGPANPKD